MQFSGQDHVHLDESAVVLRLNPASHFTHFNELVASIYSQPKISFFLHVPSALAVLKNIGPAQVAQLFGPGPAVQVEQGNKH
jgi:hypothetical protein